MTRVILENVSKNFCTMEAVKNFNLAAEDKEFLILVGPFLDVENQPIRLPGLKSGVCSGLILSGAFYPDLKIGVWRRRTYQTLSGSKQGHTA